MKIKKEYLIRLLVLIITFLGISIFSKVETKASIGDYMPSPEKGWTRYTSTDKRILYTGLDWRHKENYSSAKKKGDSLEFSINGKGFKIISNICDCQNYGDPLELYGEEPIVYVDGKKIGNIRLMDYKAADYAVSFEYEFDEIKRHDIKVTFPNDLMVKFVDTYEKRGYNWIFEGVDVKGELISGTTEPDPVEKLNPVLQVEQPVIGKVYQNKIPISGYSLNQSGVKSVTTYIDNNAKLTHNCTIGIKRNDVDAIKNKYPGYPNPETSGFSTSYNLNDIGLGVHKLVIISEGTDGTKAEKILWLQVFKDGSTKITETKVIDNKDTLVPLYRYYNGSNDHFYTTYTGEIDGRNPAYHMESPNVPMCKVYANQAKDTVPLYRYYNAKVCDHFYTTDYSELGAGSNDEYVYEGIQCYVYNKQVPGSVPVYRYLNRKNSCDHFYTTSYSELGSGVPGAWQYEGARFYVIPN